MKRSVAFMCVLVMCMGILCTAYAVAAHTCEWKLQNTGHTEYRSYNENSHKYAVEQIAVCKICGKTNGLSYALIGDELAHRPGDKYVIDAHLKEENMHIFYKLCTVCNGRCAPVKLPCSGANGAHIESP